MIQTKLIYMEHMQQYNCSATIMDMQNNDDSASLLLDQTVFYPQGGGQPYDVGIISQGENIFEVKEVRYIDGQVHHIGNFLKGVFEAGDIVTCQIDSQRRKINTRLHSIGHLMDFAIQELGLEWTPTKGYHFPEGPYIEYKGDMGEKALVDIAREVEEKCNEIISKKIKTHIEFTDGKSVNEKPLRIVYYGTFGIPCGGTHVENLGDIESVTIRKIKKDKNKIRISYT